MKEIENLDARLTPILSSIVEVCARLSFSYICGLADEATITKQKYMGVYRIDILTPGRNEDFNAWAAQFRAEWDLPEYKQKFTCTTKDKRINRHGVLEEWMPLYIGKSKTVGTRVIEHLRLPLEARTFALKILSRPNMRDRQFRLSAIQLNVQNYDLIAPVLERELRDRLNPIVGKQ
jgi:hypothetical protein